jgi:hypothetical protein
LQLEAKYAQPRLPAARSIKKSEACFTVRDGDKQALATKANDRRSVYNRRQSLRSHEG